MGFRFLNIPVQIHPTFWIFFLFFTDILQDPSVQSVILGAVLIGSLLVHEYGHALMAQYFGASPRITLEGFGGRATYDGSRMTAAQDFFITLNGPLLESILIIIPYFLLERGTFENQPYVEYVLWVTMRLNIYWCLFNLLPVVPLDGGHLVGNLLERKFGEKGRTASMILGIVCAAVAAPYYYLNESYIFGTLLLFFAFQNYQGYVALRGSSEEHYHYRSYTKALEAIQEGDLASAKALLSKLLKSTDAHIKHLATESLAEIYFAQNEGQKAYDLLLKADQQLLSKGKCLLCKLAFERNNFELIGLHARDIYDIEPSYETALLNSRAFAYLKQPGLAGAWLETASQFGEEFKAGVIDLLQHQTYDTVRDDDLFKEYAGKILA